MEEATETDTRHKPSCRSKTFDTFMNKLDRHTATKCTLARPRKCGEDRDRAPPKCTKNWMLKEHSHQNPDCNDGVLMSDMSDLHGHCNILVVMTVECNTYCLWSMMFYNYT